MKNQEYKEKCEPRTILSEREFIVWIKGYMDAIKNGPTLGQWEALRNEVTDFNRQIHPQIHARFSEIQQTDMDGIYRGRCISG